MRRILRVYGVMIFAFVLLVSCSKVPDGILSEKKMQSVLTDMLLAEAMVNGNYGTYKSDTMKLALYQSVFRKHKITKAVYDSSLVWYGRNLDIYMGVYDRVLADLNKRISDLGDVQANALPESTRDSVNIWPRRSFMAFYPKSVFNGVTFDIRPDMSYSSGSSFVLGMHVWGLDAKKPQALEVRVCADQGDTTVLTNSKILKDGYHEAILKTVPTKQIKRVYGFVYMNQGDSSYYKVYVDSLSLVKYNYGKDNL